MGEIILSYSRDRFFWSNESFFKPSSVAFEYFLNDTQHHTGAYMERITNYKINFTSWNRAKLTITASLLSRNRKDREIRHPVWMWDKSNKHFPYWFMYPTTTKDQDLDTIVYELIPDYWCCNFFNKNFRTEINPFAKPIGVKKLTSEQSEITTAIKRDGRLLSWNKQYIKQNDIITTLVVNNNDALGTVKLTFDRFKNDHDALRRNWYKQLNDHVNERYGYRFNTPIQRLHYFDEVYYCCPLRTNVNEFLTQDYWLFTKTRWDGYPLANSSLYQSRHTMKFNININVDNQNYKEDFQPWVKDSYPLANYSPVEFEANAVTRWRWSELLRFPSGAGERFGQHHGNSYYSFNDLKVFEQVNNDNLSYFNQHLSPESGKTINTGNLRYTNNTVNLNPDPINSGYGHMGRYADKVYWIYWNNENPAWRVGVIWNNAKREIGVVTNHLNFNTEGKRNIIGSFSTNVDFENQKRLYFWDGSSVELDLGQNNISYDTYSDLVATRTTRFEITTPYKVVTKIVSQPLENFETSNNRLQLANLEIQAKTASANFAIQQNIFNLENEKARINNVFGWINGLANIFTATAASITASKLSGSTKAGLFGVIGGVTKGITGLAQGQTNYEYDNTIRHEQFNITKNNYEANLAVLKNNIFNQQLINAAPSSWQLLLPESVRMNAVVLAYIETRNQSDVDKINYNFMISYIGYPCNLPNSGITRGVNAFSYLNPILFRPEIYEEMVRILSVPFVMTNYPYATDQ